MVLKKIFILFCFFCIFHNCDLPLDQEPPDTPVWIPKSQPQDSVETGIDAVPEKNSIFMHWYPVSDRDLEGYKIYRADIKDELNIHETGYFEQVAGINIYHNPEFDTLYYDEDVQINRLYRYFLRAYDYDGNLSSPSDTIEYKLIEKATLISPIDKEEVSTTPVFKWRNTARTNEIVIRLEEFPSARIIWITRFNSPGFTEEIVKKPYNFDQSAKLTALESGMKYRWRIDCIAFTNPDATDLEGSESAWQYFTVNQ
ncbi:MAG: hypothetical protein ACLFQM_03030 [Fidelibacterota bacterium]